MKLSVFCIFLASCFVMACAHQTPQYAGAPQAENSEEIAPESEPLPSNIPAAKTGDDLNDQETDMAHLPVEFNEKVTKWIEYFQGRGREHMKRHLSRSSRYLPEMKEIFRKEGLPEDLVYIALIESGFNSSAYSHASAVGYWQFIRGTGRRYGLQQNYYVDERQDYIKSTEAAAKYLKALYNLFGSWYLAIASYNVGENRIKNLVMKYYTRDFWELAKNRRLPRETENYLPKFLAARLIAKHPQKYGFSDVPWQAPLDYKEITYQKGIDLKKLAKHINVGYKELRALNPAFRRGIIPHRKGGAKVRVPSHITEPVVIAGLQKSSSSIKMKIQGQYEWYRVRSGDTLGHIARRFRTSITAIRRANNLRRRSMIYKGQKLKIPARSYYKRKPRATAAVKPAAGEKSYTVREGDSLYTIARKFGTTISKLKKRNNLGRRSLIRAGKILIIPRTGAQTNKSGNSRVHVVKPGDTLSAIASRYNVSLSKLTAANDLKRRGSLNVGKRLVIP